MNRCDYFVEKLSSYLDGEMSDAEMNDIEQHLNECDSCSLELDILKTIVSTCSELEEELPEGFNSSLHTRLEKAKEDVLNKRNRAARMKLFSQIAAGFVIVITLGIVVRSNFFNQRRMMTAESTSDSAPMAVESVASGKSATMGGIGLSDEAAEKTKENVDTKSQVIVEQSVAKTADGLNDNLNEEDSSYSIQFNEDIDEEINRVENEDTQVIIRVDDIGKAIELIMEIEEELGESDKYNMNYLEDSICAYRGTRKEIVELKLIYTNENVRQSFLTKMQEVFLNSEVELVNSEDEQEYIRVIIQKN